MKYPVFLFLNLFLSACSWFEPHYLSGLEGQPLPDFSLRTDGDILFHTATLSSKQGFVLFLYKPTCAYCNAQMQDVLQHITDFSSTKIFLITSAPRFATKGFALHYHLEKYPNIILLRDSANLLMNYFKAPGVPYTAFYDNKRKLKKVIIGKNDFSLIKNSLTE